MTENTDLLKREHKAAEKCHIYFEEFNDHENIKLRDYFHYTGLYWGVDHSNYNLKYKISDQILIVFYNLKKWDGHSSIKGARIKKLKKFGIRVIAEKK